MDFFIPLGATQRGFVTDDIDAVGRNYRPVQVDADGIIVPRGAIPQRAAPAANTAAVVTIAAVAGARHQLCYIAYNYSAAPAAGTLLVEDGVGTTVFSIPVVTAAIGGDFADKLFFSFPLRGSVNTALVITLPAGGIGISGILNIGYFDVSSA